MIRSAFAAAFLVAGSLSAQQDGRPVARVRLDPGPTVTVGQPLRITVEILAPSYFTGAPRYQPLQLRDALTVFEDRGSNFSERRGRQTLAGQRRAFVVYPQRAGTFRIDEIEVTVPYFDDDEGRTTATVSPPAFSFEAVLPPEAEGLSYFISTTRLSLRATYDPMPDTIRVGEAFSRTVVATVQDALSMVVPSLAADSVAGLAIYADPPLVEDRGGERGEQIVGTRSETTTFVALAEGAYEVPGVQLRWWDVNARTLRTAAVDPISFVVLPSVTESTFELEVDSSIAAAAPAETSRRIDVVQVLRLIGAWLLVGVAAAWLGVWIWRRFGRSLFDRWQAAKAAEAESEAAYFRRVRDVARRGDPRATLRELTAWYDRLRGPGYSVALQGWIDSMGDADLASEYERLVANSLALRDADPWDGSRLVTVLSRARKAVRTGATARIGLALPPLNPNV